MCLLSRSIAECRLGCRSYFPYFQKKLCSSYLRASPDTDSTFREFADVCELSLVYSLVWITLHPYGRGACLQTCLIFAWSPPSRESTSANQSHGNHIRNVEKWYMLVLDDRAGLRGGLDKYISPTRHSLDKDPQLAVTNIIRYTWINFNMWTSNFYFISGSWLGKLAGVLKFIILAFLTDSFLLPRQPILWCL